MNVFRATESKDTFKTTSYYGTIEANQRRTMSFTVDGKLESLAKQHQRFSQGTLIAQLDQTRLLAQKKALNADLLKVPPEQLNQPRTQQIRSQLDSLDQLIAQHEIKAPYDCVVTRTHAVPGTAIRTNQPVVSVIEMSNPSMTFSLPRRIARSIIADRDYYFVFEGKSLIGRLQTKSLTETTPGNITLSFTIQTDMSKVSFSFGQSVEARFKMRTAESGCWIPLSSIQKNSNGIWTVFVVAADKNQATVQRQIVDVKQIRQDKVLVSKELAGTLIIKEGTNRIVKGQLVEVNLPDNGQMDAQPK